VNANDQDTIVAPATPIGRSALAIVRIDGPHSTRILSDLGAPDLADRVATLVRLSDGGEIDEAIAIRYQKPRSFTGNDMVEVTLHGSPVVVERFLSAVRRKGARLAEPGEFTERAVLNGKIDLVQAEAIGELIASRTDLQARLSLNHLSGELSRLANELRQKLLEVISKLEAALDFAEEGYEFLTRQQARDIVVDALERIEALRQTYGRGRSAAAGLTAVLLGRPNAGKSTLLNFLCGTDRAIVTPIPGTTRDLLRETIVVGGLPVTLVDTAGIRASGDVVEEIGVRRAREEAQGADLVLYLVDATVGLIQEDRRELEQLPQGILIYTKTDLREAPAGELGVSVPGRRGLSELLGRLDGLVQERYVPPEGSPAIVNERQRTAIEECAEALRAGLDSLDGNAQEEVVVVDLYRAAHALGVLTGAITNAEVMQEIFAKFCIGK
jgi:tRNA modification GTPase